MTNSLFEEVKILLLEESFLMSQKVKLCLVVLLVAKFIWASEQLWGKSWTTRDDS